MPDQDIVPHRRELPAAGLACEPSPPGAAVAVVLDPPPADIDIARRAATPDGMVVGVIHPEGPLLVPPDQRVAGQERLHLLAGQRMRRLQGEGVVGGQRGGRKDGRSENRRGAHQGISALMPRGRARPRAGFFIRLMPCAPPLQQC